MWVWISRFFCFDFAMALVTCMENDLTTWVANLNLNIWVSILERFHQRHIEVISWKVWNIQLCKGKLENSINLDKIINYLKWSQINKFKWKFCYYHKELLWHRPPCLIIPINAATKIMPNHMFFRHQDSNFEISQK